MANYPTLSQNPDAQGFKIEPVVDPTIRSEKESGVVITRARFTTTKKKWTLKYSQLSDADKILLETFEYDTVRFGSDSFTWVNPQNSTSYTVRFSEKITYQYVDNNAGEWDVTVVLEQV